MSKNILFIRLLSLRLLSLRLLSLFLLFASHFSFAQKKDKNIGTEVVNVVKPYTPTISDAFKVKEIPILNDSDNSKKEEIKYNFFSFPVASTFVPSKGRAANVDKSQAEKLFKNFANLGLGNYTSLNAELFVTENISDHEYIGGMFRHLSSQGGIKNVPLNNNFYSTSLDLTYGNQLDNLTWISDIGYQNQMYNWFGIPDYLAQPFIDRINPKHTFNNFYIGTNLSFTDSFINEASLKYNRFWDARGSVENRFYVKPSFEFDLLNQRIKTNFIVDYLGGNFEKNFFGTNSIKYGFTNFGIHPNIAVNKNDWAINLGVSVFYSADNENNSSKLYVYPQVNASLKVIGDFMIFYTGIEGGLDQNSYRDFSNNNPFVSPTLAIAPTDKQFDLFAGLKGKWSNNISYTIRGSVQNEKNKPLFKSNPFNMFATNTESYQFGNSFGVVYDNIKTVGLFGELKADFSIFFSIGLNGTYSQFFGTFQDEAWNLPSIKLGSNINVNITKKWFAGANVFYVGERKEFKLIAFEPAYIEGIQTLKSYFDANFNIGYNHSERLTGFLKFNNIANQSYQKWLNYPVQGLQVLLGASYKFDF
jgi:hypothetical protein